MQAKQHSQKSRQPPFAPEKSLVKPSEIIHPAAVRHGYDLVLPERDLKRFLSMELQTPKLDKLHSWLWLAGLPVPARSLQRQRMMNRTVFLTERPDEHLVWYQDRLFLKPLPNFLLCHAFWEQNMCHDDALHHSACGMLLSYAWLVEYKSDFDLAKQLFLIPDGVEWLAWATFMKDFLSRMNLDTLAQVDRRYQFGELRLSRLNLLTRYVVPSLWSTKNLVFGFTSTSTWYRAFFERNFAWLLVAFVYVNLILSALQVGLATHMLQHSQPFYNMSYGIVLASITGVFLGVASMLLVWFSLFWYHLLSTMFFMRRTQKRRNVESDKFA